MKASDTVQEYLTATGLTARKAAKLADLAANDTPDVMAMTDNERATAAMNFHAPPVQWWALARDPRAARKAERAGTVPTEVLAAPELRAELRRLVEMEAAQ